METPQFRPHLTPTVVPPDQLYLLSEQGVVLLRGRSVACVAELLDGQRDVDDIIAAADGVSEGQVRYVLAHLESRGYTCEACDELDQGSAAYWSSLGFSPGEATARLAGLSVSITAVGDSNRLNGGAGEILRKYLEMTGIACHPPVQGAAGAPAGAQIVLCDDYLNPELEQINRAALAAGRSWLLCRPVGLDLLIGPVFVPGETGCWACLQQRLAANRTVEDYLAHVSARGEGGSSGSRAAALPSLAPMAGGLLATEIARWLVSGQTGLAGAVLSISTLDWRQQLHPLTRRPQCAACGDPDMLREPQPIRIESCPKTHSHDGGHRAASPAATLRRLGHHVSPITGVVHTLERITPEDDELQHVFVSGQNMALEQASYQQLRRNLRSRSCGKGVSEAQARVSAICEAIERYSGVFRGTEPRRLATYGELGEAAIDPRDCMLYSERQYRERDLVNARGSFFNRVPLSFDPEREVDWSPVWSLTREQFRYLPTPLLYYSYPVADGEVSCLPDSNGCAAGNTREEAILQGLLELVERDAVACWWYNRAQVPEVDLDTTDHPYVQKLRRRHAEMGRHLWVLDLRSDLGIPVFVALSRRVDRSPQDIVFAPAAHLDPEVALLRALTELNQMMPAVGHSEPGQYAYDDEECIHWWRTATLDNQPYLAPTPATPTDLAKLTSPAADDIRDDVAWLQSRIEALGLELLVLDQTRPDIDLAVVKVIVPGMRHFWARYAPGRLYDVPVKLGWRDQPLDENDLNPISIFI